VATEQTRIELHLDSDPRFAAAAGGAVRYLAEACGMSEQECKEIQNATVEACLKAFEKSPAGRHIVEFLRFDNRLEVVVDSKAGSSAVRLSRPVSTRH
jgi:anti-sigma regulatory factor (Ser/Thr protein kinase)